MSSGYGRENAGQYVGIVMYADDLLLISATCDGLRWLIDICEQEMTWLDMPGSHVWSGMDRDTIKSVSTYFGMGSNSEAKVTSTPYGTGMYPHFYKWLGTDHGGTESRRTHRK